MTIRWFESTALSERYCRIDIPGRPAIYVFPKDMTNTYALAAVRFGSADIRFRAPGTEEFFRVPDGAAHFLEHRMFTDEEGEDAIEKFAALGADANAYTTFDVTAYMINTTDRFAESYAQLLRMVSRPNFTEESVRREAGIIAQEIKMYEDEPEDVCYMNLMKAMYSLHPIRSNVCGTVKSISHITPQTLYDCHAAFYSPCEMITIVCGRVDPDEVADIVCREIPEHNAAKIERYRYAEPDGVVSRRVVSYRQVSKPVFAIGIKDNNISADPRTGQRRRLLISVINRLIFASSGDLYNSLYNEGLLTSSLSYGHESGDNYSFVTISSSADKPDEVFDRICTHINQLREGGIAKEDFERCRRARLSDIIGRYDSTEDIANSMVACAFRGIDIFTDNDIVSDLKTYEANALLHELYNPQRFALSVVMPRRASVESSAAKE